MRHALGTIAGFALTSTFVAPCARGQEVLWQAIGDKAEDEFGTHVFAIGDMNGDGAGDFAASAPVAANFNGVIRALDGRTGLKIFDVVGSSVTSLMGLDQVADVGDVPGFR
jgi:hypothetical protein